MGDSIFKKVQLVGTSKKSFSDAVANALAKAAETEQSVSWFEVVEQRGRASEGKIEYQVTVNIGCKIA